MDTKLPDISTQFAEWYQEVIVRGGLIDTSPTRGCFVIKPYGYAIWEQIVRELDAKIKETGTQNAYFPLLIPQSFIAREAKHIEGFSPELAVVTVGGGEKLEEPLIVRPTSETIIYYMFERWIKSWRDLPLKVNQWANVVRWEMRTRPFVRSLEFLWQEGHTAHATHEEATAMVQQAIAIYKSLYEDYLAVPVITGVKTPTERFAGADQTCTIEGLMQDGKALQMGTAHILAQSFPASFGVQYQGADGTLQTPYCTSWGMTTRSLGALVMTHGDSMGLILPPRIAPTQVVIVPIFKTAEEKQAVFAAGASLAAELKEQGIRVLLDTNEQDSPGAKYYHWDQQGVPVRIELGPKDLANNQVMLVSRIEQEKAKKKQSFPQEQAVTAVKDLLSHIQQELLARAWQRVKANWHQADDLTEFGPRMDQQHGLYQTGWCGQEACEVKVKEYKGTVRCIIEPATHTKCFVCKAPSSQDILVAKAY